MDKTERPIVYLGSTKKDLKKLPSEVRDVFAQGLYMASLGEVFIDSKLLKGFGGRSVVELIEDCKSDTYRAVYTVKFKVFFTCCMCLKRRATKELKHQRRIKS